MFAMEGACTHLLNTSNARELASETMALLLRNAQHVLGRRINKTLDCNIFCTHYSTSLPALLIDSAGALQAEMCSGRPA